MFNLPCPICGLPIAKSDYLSQVFKDDLYGEWAASAVTHHRHQHIKYYDLSWQSYRYGKQSRYNSMTHDEFKSMVNNRGKRRLIKALDKARVDRGDKIKLFQGFVKLQHNDGDTLNLLNHMALKYGFPSVTKSESPRLRPIPLPFLGQPGVCCHCGKELPKRRRKWCSDDCQINYDRLRGFSYRYATIEENLKKFKVLTCEKCLKPIEFETDAIADHILPLAEGGDHNVSNLQILCSVCNTEKTRADLSKIVLRRARGKSEAHRAKNSTLDAFLSL